MSPETKTNILSQSSCISMLDFSFQDFSVCGLEHHIAVSVSHFYLSAPHKLCYLFLTLFTVIEGNNYETRQISLLQVFVRFFGLDRVQNTIVIYSAPRI